VRGGQSLATAAWQAGDTAKARAYADSGLAESAKQAAAADLAVRPADAQLHALHGLLLAYLGRGTEARAAIARALAVQVSGDDRAYLLLNAARIELALGDRRQAVAHLEEAQKIDKKLNGNWLSADPRSPRSRRPGVRAAAAGQVAPRNGNPVPPRLVPARLQQHLAARGAVLHALRPATPTDPGVPPRAAATGEIEVAQVTRALAGRYKIERVLGEGAWRRCTSPRTRSTSARWR